MNRSNLPGLILLVCYLSIPITGSAAYFGRQPIPQMRILLPPHNFNGTEAYSLLENLTRNFSGRVVGARNDTLASSWIASWFRTAGLNATMQVFPTIDFQGRRVNGTNVYAVSPGSSNQVVILLAHHDIVPRTDQGADDNGSGTVVLMELAKSLTQAAHNLTYYFLSTDSEEINLGGSLYFAQHNSKVRNVSLALSIDEVGFKQAQNLLVYAYSHQSNYTDAGTLLTASNIGEKLSLPTTPLVSDQLARRSGINLFTSDSESFLTEGIQSYALADDNPLYPYTHTPMDTIEQVSAVRLDRVGSWVETLAYNLNQGLVAPHLGEIYLIYADGYTPGYAIAVHLGTYILAALAAPAWFLSRVRPPRSQFLTAGKPVLATFLILVASAILPLLYKILGLWPAGTSILQQFLITSYVGEIVAVIAVLLRFSSRIFRAFAPEQLIERSQAERIWVTILMSGTFLANMLVSPFATLLFLSLPPLLTPLAQMRRRGGTSIRLLSSALTPFPLYVVGIGGILIYGFQRALTVIVNEIATGGIILDQLSGVVAIIISLGYSFRESLKSSS